MSQLDISKLEVFRTIKLGTGLKSHEDFLQPLVEIHSYGYGGGFVSRTASAIMEHPSFTTANTEMEVDLVAVEAEDLNCEPHATLREFYDRAMELGLELCPPEVGPQLRLQYEEQPLWESLNVAVDLVEVVDNWRRGQDHRYASFTVNHEQVGLLLYGYWFTAEDECPHWKVEETLVIGCLFVQESNKHSSGSPRSRLGF
jgi:hypothetical protein